MTIQQNQNIKIIPENIKEISIGKVISVEQDCFTAEITSSIETLNQGEAEVHISDENFILIFNTKILKIEKNKIIIKNPKKYNYIQKREYPRISTKIPLKINTVKEKKETNAEIINIGGGGMKISSPVAYSPDSLLNTNFTLPSKTSVNTLFYTLRCEMSSENKNIFAISGKFKNITTLEKTAIIQFCFKQKLELSGLKPDINKKNNFFN